MTFTALYLFAALSLFGLAILTGVLYEHGRSAIRRWRCQREMRDFDPPQAWERPFTRRELDGLATARDKAERKIQ